MLALSLWRRLFVFAVLLSAPALLAQSADLSVSLSDTPDPITLGTGTVTYTAGLFNGGTATATSATITFNAPAGSTIGTISPNLSGSCTTVGQTVTCVWASVASGSSRSVSIVTTPTAGGTLTATASVSAVETDPNSGNNNASTTTTVNANIDLQIYQMSDTPDPITLGTGDITYTTYIYNASSSKATNPVLTLTLPPASTFVSAAASNSGTCSGTTTVTCSWAGDLTSGSTRYVTLVVTPTAGGTATLGAAVDGDQPDHVPANDTATHSTTVNASIDLQIYQMSDTPDPITLGTGTITYTTYIYNASSSKATNPVLTLTLPATTTFGSATASNSGTCSGTTTVTCSWAGDLTSGGTRYVTLVVTPTAGGTATLGAAVDGDQPDHVPANDTATHSTTVNASIDLQIYQMSDTPDPITLGTGTITYTTYIYNASSSKATNPVLTLTLPATTTFGSATASNSGTCSGTTTVTCSWAGDLTSGGTRYVTLVVTPTAGGTATLTAAVDGDQPDHVPANDTATHSTTVNEFIDLQIYQMSDTPDPITLGTGTITYTTYIYNASSSKATNPVLTLTLPATTTFGSATASNSGTCSGTTTVTCSWAGDLTSGSTRYVTLVVTPTAGGTATLTAAVDGDQPDNVPANDTATHSTTVNEFIDLQIYSMSDTPDPITLGTGNITYTTYIYNASSSKATNPVLTLTLPATTTFVSATASSSGTCSGTSTITCSWAGDLTSGNTRYVTLIVTPTAGGTATLTAAIDGDQPDNVNGNDSATHSTTVNEFIDLQIYSMSDTPDPITLGTGNITYTTYIYNASSSKATNPVLTLTRPAASTFVSATASSSGTCSGTSTITCSWAGDLTSGNTRYVTLIVTPTAGGTATLTAAIDGDQPDNVNGNDSATHSTTVNEFIDLQIYSMSDTPDPITLGTGNITYSTYIYNASSSKATNPVLTLTLPPSSTFFSATASNSGTCTGTTTVTCSWAGDLTAGNTRNVSLVVTPTAGGTLTLNAAVDGDQPDNVNGNDTGSQSTTVNASIELSVSLSDTPDPRVIGAGNVTYSAFVTNSSSSKATTPKITFTIPSTTSYVSHTATSATCTVGASTVECTWADVGGGSSRSASFVVSPSQVGQLTATVTITADQPDPNSGNNTATATTNVNPGTIPSISTFTPTSGPAGTTVTISGSSFFSATAVKFNGTTSTYVVNNNGSITATVPNGATTGTIAITNANGTGTSSGQFTVTPAPDLSIGKSASATTTPTSSSFSYTLTVSNIGAGGAADVTVTDTLPAGVTLTSVSGTNWTCSGTSTVTCVHGALAASSSAPSITINVTAPASGTTVTNTATVDSTTPDNNAANDSSTVSVGVVGCPTTPAITAPATVCSNSTGHVASTPSVPGATYAWGIINGTITSSTTANTITFDASSTDPVTLTVSVFVTSCPTAINSVNVNVSTPTASITPSGATTFCAGSSVTLTANNGASYLWSTGETTQSITVTTSGNYDVAVTDAAGCTVTSAPTTVTVNPIPSALVTAAGPTTFCEGGSVTLNAPAGMASYFWSTGETSPSIVADATGSYFVTVTSTAGCSNTSAPISVTEQPAPNATITASGPVTFCAGDSVTLTASAGSSWLWSTSETTQSITVSAAGNYTVTVTDAGGCSATSAATTVTVNPLPVPVITGPASACGSATLDAGSGYVSYLWSTTETSQTINVTTSGTYSVTVTDANGCSATTSHVITMTAPPPASIQGPATVCSTDMPVTLDAGSGFVSYLWSTTETTQSISVSAGGTYSVTVTDANGCTATATHTLTVNPAPAATVTASGPTTFCDGGSVTLTANAAQSYAWSNGQTTQSITVSTGGTYTVTTTDNACSTTSAPVTVTVNPPANVTITGPAATCSSAPVTLDAGPGFASYNWSTGETTRTISVAATDTYTVTVVDANGCSASDSHAVTVTNTPANSVATSGPTTFCAGDSVTLTASPAASYAWSNGATTQSITVGTSGTFTVTTSNGACSATSAPVNVTVHPAANVAIAGPASACGNATLDAGPGFASYNWSTGETTRTISVAATDTYTVTVVDANGCSASDSHAVTVTNTPANSVATSGPTTFCAGESVTLTASPASSYAWSNGATMQSITVGTSGTFTVTSSNGACSATSAPVTVTVHTAANVAISGPASACANATLDAGPGFSSYNWSTGETTRTVNVTSSGTYTVTVLDANGCSATDSHAITVTGTIASTITAPASATAGDSGLTASVPAQSGATYAWTITNGSITAGAGTRSITFTAGSVGTTTLSVTVTGGACSGTDTHDVTVVPESIDEADVSIAKFAPTSVSTGATFSYTLAVRNDGPSNATSVVVADTLPAGVTLVSADGGAFQCSALPGGVICSGVLAVNAVNTLTLTVTAPQQSGTITNTASIDGGMADPQPHNNSASATTSVTVVSEPCAARATPTLIAPANNATLVASSVTLQWSAASGASGYRLWAVIDGAPEAVIGTTTSNTSLQVVIPHGNVEWWAEALYEGCASTESTHARFTIPRSNDCTPQTPNAQSPSNTTVSSAEVTFQWSPVPSAVSYEVWLAVDNGTPTLIGTTTATSLTETVAAGTLDWFVRAVVSGCPSRDSQTARFTYTPPANCGNPQRPNAVSPLPDAHVTSPIDFAWTPVDGATRYELFEVHGNGERLLATTTTAAATNVALANGNARWFVRAHLGAGCSPLDSAEQRLVVVPTPAACATLVAPRTAMVSQISSALPIVVQWNEVPGATSYQLQLASDASFTNAEVITTDKTVHTLTRTNSGNTPIAVHARVRAIDARCAPEPTVTPYGTAAVTFILPATGTEMSAPLTGGDVSQQLVLGRELAGQSFSASANQPWLSVSPTHGVVAAGGSTLTVSAITNGLPIGTSLGAIHVDLTSPSSGSVQTHAGTRSTTTISIGKVSPVMPTLKTAPPPDALIIPAVAHADGINSKFQSDVRVTNSSAQLLNYQVSFTPTGDAGIASGKQTQFSIEPGRTIALDDVLKSWFGTGGASVTGTLEVRPLTQTATSTSSNPLSGLPNLVTFASSRTFNVTANGTFGQYIPAIPFANFIGKGLDLAKPSVLSLQQIAQSDRYRTNLGIVEGSGEAVSLLVKVFGNNGAKLTEFPVNLAGGQHTQLNSFLVAQGVGPVTDGRIEVSVVGGNGKVTAYASVLDNDTSDPLLVTPVTLSDSGAKRWVMPGVADLNNGTANWQTDMRVFNAGTADVETTLTFYSQNGGTPKTAQVTIAAGQVKQFDRTLASVFGASNDGGAVHITTDDSARLIATARTYNQTSSGTYGQFISAVTTNEAAGVGSRPLQLLQVEESDRFRSNIGLAEVTGNPVKLEISIVPPDAKFTAVTEVTLQPNEFRQLNSLLRSAGLGETYNARVTVRAVEGAGRVTAYASVIDMQTNDPTYVPAQ